MTTLSRELATKRPAQVVAQSSPTVDATRRPDGRFKAVRGGPTSADVFRFVLLLFMAVGFAGFLLSLLSQQS